MHSVNDDLLLRLRGLTSPTIANAMQSLKIACSNFDSEQVVCRIPTLGAMVGYAVTATVRTESLDGERPAEDEWWDYLSGRGGPKVVVLQNVDGRRKRCATWGGVQSNIHRALGCGGLLTDGLACDLEDAELIGFHLFTAGIAATHGYLEFCSIGAPVTVGGLTIGADDLIHADRYGAIVIPPDMISPVLVAVAERERREAGMIALCQRDDVTLEQIRMARKAMRHG